MIPKVIIIVPYRDRKEHYNIFSKRMEKYRTNGAFIFYVHQADNRPFNRGAMKNIGFLAIKDMYPKDYKKITIVFNDIDSISPVELDFETKPGIIKHFYGFHHALGGIVSITSGDFEKLDGFPNLWSWGYEDNALFQRSKRNKLLVNRDVFYKVNDKRFVRLAEDNIRDVNPDDFQAYKRNNEGIHNITNLKYDIDKNGFINVTNFDTGREPNYSKFRQYNLINGSNVFNGKIQMKFL